MMGLAVHHDFLIWGNGALREHGGQFVVRFKAELARPIDCVQPVEVYSARDVAAPLGKYA